MSHPDRPPLRSAPLEPDGHDGRRVELVHRLWHGQDGPLRQRDRQVEENIRMLSGRQWDVWNDMLGRFVDITRYMSDEERRWRQRPVVNRLLYWYMLIHSRLTENAPVVSFQPATGDRIDAELAEVMDTVFKTLWEECGMLEVLDRLMAWLIPGGSAYLKSRVDLERGPLREWIGPGMLSLLDPEGAAVLGPDGMPVERYADEVPYGADGEPLARLTGDGEDYEIPDGARPHREHEGGLAVDVLSPLEVRGQWGPQPWHRKRWHIHRSFLSAEEVRDTFEVEVEPDTFGDDVTGAGELHRLLFGPGMFGSAGARPGSEGSGSGSQGGGDGYVQVDELWEAPCRYPGMERTEESAGGRLLIVTKTRCLRDGARPVDFKHTSPIRGFDFVNVPGRPSGTSPQEMLNPIQRAYNRGWAQVLEHRNLSTNPIGVVDTASGIEEGQITNRPASLIFAQPRPGVDPVRFIPPPPLGQDVYRVQEMLGKELQDLGNIEGSEGRVPTSGASGALVEELRFNSDRFVGPTTRRAVVEIARMVEDWTALLPTIWDQEKMLVYAGEDNVARTTMVLPHMWQGHVNVIPDVESMAPEGRGERQQRITALYQMGAFGEPGSPGAVRQFLDLSNFPHMSRAARPGGEHAVTAEQENGRLVQGEAAEGLPTFEWYDDEVHLEIHERFMATPEFLKLEDETQQQFMLHRMAHLENLQGKALEQMGTQMAMTPEPAVDAGAAPPMAMGAEPPPQPIPAAGAA